TFRAHPIAEVIMNPAKRIGPLALALAFVSVACSSDDSLAPSSTTTSGAGGGGGSDGGPTDDGATMDTSGKGSPVDAVPISETLRASALSAPIDIVRDEWGNPHI